jgi:hypothetical protein
MGFWRFEESEGYCTDASTKIMCTKSETCEDLMTAWAHRSHEVFLTSLGLYEEVGWDEEDL